MVTARMYEEIVLMKPDLIVHLKKKYCPGSHLMALIGSRVKTNPTIYPEYYSQEKLVWVVPQRKVELHGFPIHLGSFERVFGIIPHSVSYHPHRIHCVNHLRNP